jgi:6,7-dimethyl-8-ribityllumazine synthase
MNKAEPHPLGSDFAISIVVARENEDVTRRLLRGAEDVLKARAVDEVDVHWVPTAFDLALVALTLAEKGGPDAIVALGCVVDDDMAAMQTVAGLMQAQLDTGVPIAIGLLNVINVDDALARSGPKNNKGAEAAESALEMATVLREIQG